LNTGVWFRRGRLLIVSPVRGHHRRYQAETPLIPLSRFAEPALTKRSADMFKSLRGLFALRTILDRGFGFDSRIDRCGSINNWRSLLMALAQNSRVGRTTH